MRILASFFLALAVWLSAYVGPLTAQWSWGMPALSLALAVLCSLRTLWTDGDGAGAWLRGCAVAALAWFAWRAWRSPVAEAAVADMILAGMAVGGFLVVRAIRESRVALRILLWGLWGGLLLNVAACFVQASDPGFRLGWVSRCIPPAGLFGEYNHAANFIAGVALLIAGAAAFGRCWRTWERMLWGIVALAALPAVYLTTSRGGQLGAACGVAVFVVMALIGARRRKSKWFGIGLIGAPFAAIALVALLGWGWANTQKKRNQADNVATLMDNSVRLHLAGIAVSCVTEHPWTGGGSRSFGWECNRFWNVDEHGHIIQRPELTHNELLESATDYGLVGMALVFLTAGSVLVLAWVRAGVPDDSSRGNLETGLQAGGASALVATLVASCFSFVFHLSPGILLLGVCLGFVTGRSGPSIRPRFGRWLSPTLALCCAGWLGWYGWLGSRVTVRLWTTQFQERNLVLAEDRIEALGHALAIWPLADLYFERGTLYQELAAKAGKQDRTRLCLSGEADYGRAIRLQPFDPRHWVNRANLFAALEKDDEASAAFERAVVLQGGMEETYNVLFLKADYLAKRSARQQAAGHPDNAMSDLFVARDCIKGVRNPETAYRRDAINLRLAICVRLAGLLEAAGRDAEAEEEYAAGAAFWGGGWTRYYHAAFCYRMGMKHYKNRQPEQALWYFDKARGVVEGVLYAPTEGVNKEDARRLADNLDERIAFLKGARVTPRQPQAR